MEPLGHRPHRREFLRAGACCLGVGSQLVDPRLVAGRAFDQLRDLAAKYVEAVRKARAG